MPISSEGGRRLPKVRGEKHLAATTLYRWATKGRRARDGEFIFLGIVRIGGTNCTSMEVLERFFARISRRKPLVEWFLFEIL